MQFDTNGIPEENNRHTQGTLNAMPYEIFYFGTRKIKNTWTIQ